VSGAVELDGIAARLPGVVVENGCLVVDRAALVAVATALRDDPEWRFDYLANLCAVDWPKKGHLEVVSHLYSVEKRTGPLTLKVRTGDRAGDAKMPSLTPIWRGAEYQEREAYDLYGVIFEGHPDLRRILMWDEFEDFPMRKDYVPPDDHDWEPTPHGDVLDAVAKRVGAK
jgi:NADH-quinone oxidoreductase subunit C